MGDQKRKTPAGLPSMAGVWKSWGGRPRGSRCGRLVARIPGVAPEIAFGDELAPRRLDFAAQRAFLDAVEALADRCAFGAPMISMTRRW